MPYWILAFSLVLVTILCVIYIVLYVGLRDRFERLSEHFDEWIEDDAREETSKIIRHIATLERDKQDLIRERNYAHKNLEMLLNQDLKKENNAAASV